MFPLCPHMLPVMFLKFSVCSPEHHPLIPHSLPQSSPFSPIQGAQREGTLSAHTNFYFGEPPKFQFLNFFWWDGSVKNDYTCTHTKCNLGGTSYTHTHIKNWTWKVGGTSHLINRKMNMYSCLMVHNIMWFILTSCEDSQSSNFSLSWWASLIHPSHPS